VTALFLALILAADAPPTQAELLQVFRDEFIAVTPGEATFPKSFAMGRADGGGAERPAHSVSFAYKFEFAKYEVPQNLWEAVMRSNPSKWKGNAIPSKCSRSTKRSSFVKRRRS